MPDLEHALQGHDLGFLKMVAQGWGIELEAPDAPTALPRLIRALHDRTAVREMVETLPPEAYRALYALLESEGSQPWALFTRRFGELRIMGAGRRDRERPDLNPQSPTEILWYRGLVAKGFFNRPPEPQEYAYIPDDLLELLPRLTPKESPPLGRPASRGESAFARPAKDKILDDATTFLAARRMGQKYSDRPDRVSAAFLQALLNTAGLLDAHGQPLPEPTRTFLEASRGEALAFLVRAWMQSDTLNELRLTPGLVFEGEWQNHPRQTRQTLLNLLSRLPQDTWWSLPAFTNAVREQHPDFQRPAGDYDSWFVRLNNSSEYLRGFASWEKVDGAMLRYFIHAILHWLGMVDLAAANSHEINTAFRPSPWAAALWHGQPPEGLPAENQPLIVSKDGQVVIQALTPRAARYQVARFCTLEDEKADRYIYRLTPESLQQAQSQGLRVTHVLSVLKRHSAAPLPPSLVEALERWEKLGVQASFSRPILLTVGAPEILTALRRTRAVRHLGPALSPTVVVVKPGGEAAVRAALTEIGYLAEAHLDV